MKKIFIGNLPKETTESQIQDLFSNYGTVRSINLTIDIFTGKCRGFGFVEMEGHEAREAIKGLNGYSLGSNLLKVKFEIPKSKRNTRHNR